MGHRKLRVWQPEPMRSSLDLGAAEVYADPPQAGPGMVDRMRTWRSDFIEYKKQETRYADDTEAR